MSKTSRQRGFTLIEIAIVLVIIGLLLGGVLKGQELITSARVRNLISQQDGIKAAYYGFQDRYRALPGDYAAAASNLGGGGTITAGNGNGQIDDASTVESILAWDHLTRAGFLNGSYAYTTTMTDTSTPKNPYGRHIQIVYDANYGTGTPAARHNLKTGNQVPVEIMAEVDRKTDDGNPYTGSFMFSTWASGGTALTASTCATAAVVGPPAVPAAWNITAGTTDCGGATLL